MTIMVRSLADRNGARAVAGSSYLDPQTQGRKKTLEWYGLLKAQAHTQ